jgi:hypothetical protein
MSVDLGVKVKLPSREPSLGQPAVLPDACGTLFGWILISPEVLGLPPENPSSAGTEPAKLQIGRPRAGMLRANLVLVTVNKIPLGLGRVGRNVLYVSPHGKPDSVAPMGLPLAAGNGLHVLPAPVSTAPVVPVVMLPSEVPGVLEMTLLRLPWRVKRHVVTTPPGAVKLISPCDVAVNDPPGLRLSDLLAEAVPANAVIATVASATKTASFFIKCI